MGSYMTTERHLLAWSIRLGYIWAMSLLLSPVIFPRRFLPPSLFGGEGGLGDEQRRSVGCNFCHCKASLWLVYPEIPHHVSMFRFVRLFRIPALAAAWQTDQHMHWLSAKMQHLLKLRSFFLAWPCISSDPCNLTSALRHIDEYGHHVYLKNYPKYWQN